MEEYGLLSRNGELLLLNHGDDTGLYNYDPEATPVVPVWTVQPSFNTPVPTEIGSVVSVDEGVFGPVGTTVAIEIGSGTNAADFVAHIPNGGTIPDAMGGEPMALRATLTYQGQTAVVVVPSGVTIAGVTEPEWPGFTVDPGTDFSAVELRNASVGVSGKRRFTLASTVPAAPSGSEYRAYSGPNSAGVMDDNNTRIIAPGQAFDTNGTMPIGSTCYNHLFIKRRSDGKYARLHAIDDYVSFTIQGLIIIVDPNTDDPPANETVNSLAKLVEARDARIASGSTATWIVDVENIEIPLLSWADITMPGMFIIRSKNRNLGCKINLLRLANVRNVGFHYVDFNRQGLGYTRVVAEVIASRFLEFKYNRFYTPAIVLAADKGYVRQAYYGLQLTKDGANKTYDVVVHMNEFHGPMLQQLALMGAERVEVSDNVSVNTGADFIYFGTGIDFDILRNFGSRLHYPSWDPNANGGKGDFDHSDFIQGDSRLATSYRIRYEGNIMIAAKHPVYPGITRQNIFASKTAAEDCEWYQNFGVVNAVQGFWSGPPETQAGHKADQNTCLRIIDLPNNHTRTDFAIGGLISYVRNVQQKGTTGGTFGTGGITIPIINGSYTKSRDYYVDPSAVVNGEMSSLHDMRPVAGNDNGASNPCHWNYSAGEPVGAAQRLYDVIHGGQYPKKGPAAAAFKAWYDPRNQITS